MGQLTKENYITDHSYLSFTTFSKYLECEAAAKAHYKEPTTDSMLMSSYVDAYFSGDLDKFKEEHPEIFKNTGELKKDYVKAESIIQRIESDSTFMKALSGQKQVIMTGSIIGTDMTEGVPFKIKMDSYDPDKFIVDLKVMKDLKKVWSDTFKRYASFIEAYNYDIELAIFQEIVRQNTGKVLPCYLACITKEEPSDIAILSFPQEELDKALNIVKNNLPRIKQIMDGKVAPHRCNTCAYCRMTKKAKIISFDMVTFNGDQLREEGIECDDPITK